MLPLLRPLRALFLIAPLCGPACAWASDMPPPLAALAARVLPAVVSIAAMAPAGSMPPDNGDANGNSAFHATADTPDDAASIVVPPPKSVELLGSGFVFDPAGYILTNNHVVDNAATIIVTFQDGTVYPAIVAGRDKDGDLAVLKISAGHPLPYLRFGDFGKMQIGDWVLAIGNPFGLPGSASAGIVSALHRQIGDTAFDDFIQTDAAINKGNSGGPLFNLQGQVIGVDSAIYAPAGASDGVGFAIPAAMAAPVAELLAHNGAMVRGWLGAATEDVTPAVSQALDLPTTDGALIGAVSPGGPSDGTLQPGDVITALAGVPVGRPAGAGHPHGGDPGRLDRARDLLARRRQGARRPDHRRAAAAAG